LIEYDVQPQFPSVSNVVPWNRGASVPPEGRSIPSCDNDTPGPVAARTKDLERDGEHGDPGDDASDVIGGVAPFLL
jgi:hypothetical protein